MFDKQVTDPVVDAKINMATPKDGTFPLFVAAGSGYVSIVRLLLHLGADRSQKVS